MNSTTIRTDNSACPTCCNCKHGIIADYNGMKRWICLFTFCGHEVSPYQTCPHFTPREK